MSKTAQELASELEAKFGSMRPDGDGWSWDWETDPLAREAAAKLRELAKINKSLGRLLKTSIESSLR